jgi:hypothetical protein
MYAVEVHSGASEAAHLWQGLAVLLLLHKRKSHLSPSLGQ